MMAPMRFGIMFANTVGFSTQEGAKALASAADDTGIESLWTVEHVVVPVRLPVNLPVPPTGRCPAVRTSRSPTR